jgi:hypothetical protein
VIVRTRSARKNLLRFRRRTEQDADAHVNTHLHSFKQK